jgi:molybdate transport system substrate-binding protein
MKRRSFATIVPLAIGTIMLLAPGAPANAAENDNAGAIKVICSNGLKAPFQHVQQQAEQAVGKPVAIQFGGAVGLKQAIDEKGGTFDVAILTPQVIDDFVKEGKIDPSTRTVISRTGVSAAMRGDGPKPDISTPEAFKKALLAPTTKSIRWAPTGAALPVVEKMVATLGIGDQIKSKVHTTGPAVELGPGEIEISFDLNSEQMPGTTTSKNVYLGLFPGNLLGYVTMEAAISKTASDPKGAKALIDFLKGPALDPHLKMTGMIR